MQTGTWRDRLNDALTSKGLSKRAASIAAGLGPGYVHSILAEGKDPSVDNLVAVCKVAGVSVAFVLYGIEMSPETERILRLLEVNPEARDGVLRILEAQARH